MSQDLSKICLEIKCDPWWLIWEGGGVKGKRLEAYVCFRARTDWDQKKVWHFTIWRSLGPGTRLWPRDGHDLEIVPQGWACVSVRFTTGIFINRN